MKELLGEFVDFQGGGLIVDLVLFEDAFFNKMFVVVIDHAFGEEGAWELLVKVDSVSLHEQVGCLLAQASRNEDGDRVGKTMFGGGYMKSGAD